MISDNEARNLWRRAAELQAIAEERPHDQHSLVQGTDDESALTVEDIVAAAEGAGIDPDFVRVALVEHSLPNAAAPTRADWTRMLRVLVGYETDALERATEIHAPPQSVLTAVNKLLARQPYQLTLESTFGDDALTNGILVYRLSNSRRKKFQRTGSVFEQDTNTADGKYFLVTVREADGDTTRLSIRMPLFRRGENLALLAITAGVFGWLGSALASYTIDLINTSSAWAALIPGLVGAAGIMTGAAIYRRIYRWATQKGEAALERVLQSASSEVRVTATRGRPQAEE